jgi:4-hydroxybenzoate polyprenyltransferase
LNSSVWTYIVLALSLGLIAIYDLWGKRIVFAPLMDLLQGVGWGALVLFGALATSGVPTALTWTIVIFIILFITLLNGVHGGLRDLENDLNFGVHTTAIMLGARPQGRIGASVTRTLVVYTLVLQVLLTAVTFLPLIYNWFDYEPITRAIMAFVMVILTILALVFLAMSWKSLGNRWNLLFAGTWHLVIVLTSPIVLFIPYLDRAALLILLATHILPLMTSGWMYGTLGEWQVRAEA